MTKDVKAKIITREYLKQTNENSIKEAKVNFRIGKYNIWNGKCTGWTWTHIETAEEIFSEPEGSLIEITQSEEHRGKKIGGKMNRTFVACGKTADLTGKKLESLEDKIKWGGKEFDEIMAENFSNLFKVKHPW